MPCVLLTRALEDQDALRSPLEAAGWDVISNPLLRYENMPFVYSSPLPRAWLITSGKAVEALVTLDGGRTRPVYAVGSITATLAAHAGFETFAAQGNGEDLLRLITTHLTPQDGPLVHVSGDHLRVDLEARLRPLGYDVSRLMVYGSLATPHMTPALAQALQEKRLTHALFYSRRTVDIFHNMMSQHPHLSTNSVCAIAMGPQIMERLKEYTWRDVHLAANPLQTLVSMGRNVQK